MCYYADMESDRTKQLLNNLRALYDDYQEELLFHGWHHISFVTRKALEFAQEFPAMNREYLEAAALTHDINYIVDVTSGVDDGQILRAEQLRLVGFDETEIALIEKTVHEASTENSGGNISDAAKALSDGDKLFKVLPVGPMILSARYITETKVDIRKWADRIIRDQKPLLENDVYFHTALARKKYLSWARLNLDWVEQVRYSLDDPDVQLFLDDCRKLDYI